MHGKLSSMLLLAQIPDTCFAVRFWILLNSSRQLTAVELYFTFSATKLCINEQ